MTPTSYTFTELANRTMLGDERFYYASDFDASRAELADVLTKDRIKTREINLLVEENKQLTQRAEAAEADARRYRWLRDNADITLNKHVRYDFDGHSVETRVPLHSELDTAIDSAIAAIAEGE